MHQVAFALGHLIGAGITELALEIDLIKIIKSIDQSPQRVTGCGGVVRQGFAQTDFFASEQCTEAGAGQCADTATESETFEERASAGRGIIFGLNMSLNESLTLKDGAIVEGNYDQYPMLKMADIPDIHIHLDALSGHDRFAIIGEAPVGPIGPAIGNAIFQATGKRVRTTPFRNQDLSWS